MAEYKVGQRIIDFEGDKGEIVEIKTAGDARYLLRVEDEPLQYWSDEHGFTLDDTPSEIQVSKERIAELEAALRKIAGYWSDSSIKPMTDADSIDYLVSVAVSALIGIEE